MPGYWTTALGRRKRFDRIGHQHLSNILWFKEVFSCSGERFDRAYQELTEQLNKKHGGKRKPWKPLPIPQEIEWLIKMGMIDSDKNIVFNGRIIGSIRHINL